MKTWNRKHLKKENWAPKVALRFSDVLLILSSTREFSFPYERRAHCCSVCAFTHQGWAATVERGMWWETCIGTIQKYIVRKNWRVISSILGKHGDLTIKRDQELAIVHLLREVAKLSGMGTTFLDQSLVRGLSLERGGRKDRSVRGEEDVTRVQVGHGETDWCKICGTDLLDRFFVGSVGNTERETLRWACLGVRVSRYFPLLPKGGGSLRVLARKEGWHRGARGHEGGASWFEPGLCASMKTLIVCVGNLTNTMIALCLNMHVFSEAVVRKFGPTLTGGSLFVFFCLTA